MTSSTISLQEPESFHIHTSPAVSACPRPRSVQACFETKQGRMALTKVSGNPPERDGNAPQNQHSLSDLDVKSVSSEIEPEVFNPYFQFAPIDQVSSAVSRSSNLLASSPHDDLAVPDVDEHYINSLWRSVMTTPHPVASSAAPLTLFNTVEELSIIIKENCVENIKTHFKPKDANSENQGSVERTGASNQQSGISNGGTAHQIVERYRQLWSRNSGVEDFAELAKAQFFQDSDKLQKNARADIGGGNPKWLPPPVGKDAKKAVHPEPRPFKVVPTYTYWLPLKSFPDWQEEIELFAYVLYKAGICSYLTVVMQERSQVAGETYLRAAATSAVALFRRYCLKRDALKKSGDKWNKEDRLQVKHYVITFTKSDRYVVKVWQTVPKGLEGSSVTWNGCEMRLLGLLSCDEEHRVEQLIKWIREIHNWGLTTYFTDCKKDLGVCMEAFGMTVDGDSLKDSVGEEQGNDTTPKNDGEGG